MEPIREDIFEKHTLVESDRSKLPEGVLCRVTYPICNIDEINHNDRLYEKEVWENVLSNSNIKEKLERRSLFGHAEHPKETQSNFEKTSHVVNRFWIDEDNKVKQELDVLDTPYGRIVDTVLRAKCGVGVSTRAEGDLEEKKNDTGKTFWRVVPKAYSYVTTDFTADPSTVNAYPESVQREMISHIKKGMEESSMDHDFATSLLESMSCKQAGELLESIATPKDPSFDEKEGGLLQEYNNEIKDIKEEDLEDVNIEEGEAISKLYHDAGVTPPNGKGIHTKAFHKLAVDVMKGGSSKDVAYATAMKQLGRDKAVRKAHQRRTPTESKQFVFETYDALVDYFREAFSTMSNEDKEKMLGAVSAREELIEGKETKSIEDIAKEITGLTIREASVRAERDVLQEEMEDMRHAELELAIINGNNVLKKDVLENRDKELRTLYEKLEASAIEIKKLRESYISEINVLCGKASEDKKALEERIKISESKIKEIKEESYKDVVKKYTNLRLSNMGLTVPKSTQALLERCTTIEEVDDTIDTIQEALRESTLHSPIRKISVSKDEDPKMLKIQESVFVAMTEM